MKATELMIGDWVTYMGTTPCKILSITPSFVRIANEKTNTIITSDFEDISPLPLAAKILGKNPNIEELGYWDYEVNVFRLFATPILNLWYIHQLQHALRLCGLNELADNFKV